MKIAVIGGTGLIGSKTVAIRQLSACMDRGRRTG
jgi:nucleoside-diphosphate-sugar epimerase